ncbi:hypothetical protein PZ938_11000 [Luteipulveratus sp. YIM 133132]|uniref:Uncharacterized protein n=1 Tax=Luteipulveratus flavus TaxID=3031728 RepID=A0ABT6C8W0_9MICO|nr:MULTISPECIES: hypothetical protein [unclassified Luteipulveratus]MDE9366133.1 hypothetical protein [Luteipulveratus sp. YIM 133132]MDF8265225.1 hypothetical protein [Luteipulveratus sp. YIM 133296]
MFAKAGLVLVAIVVISVVWFFVKGRVGRAHDQVRDRALEGGLGRKVTAGPAAKHLTMMGRTLTLHADPVRAGELIAHVAGADDRVTAVSPEAAAVVVEIDGSRPRVRAHLRADRTVIGVEEMSWEMGFPQGAQVWDRVADAIAESAGKQGIGVSEGTREFVKADRPGESGDIWVVRT